MSEHGLSDDRMHADRIRDLGALEGTVLVFGGAYSNLQATQALIAKSDELGIMATNRIFTGDAIGYCADPRDSWRAVSEFASVCVAGNCERQLQAGADGCGCGFADGSACDLLSTGWYAHASAQVAATPDLRAEFAGCPDLAIFEHAGRRYAVVHGGATSRSRFVWPDSDTTIFAEEIVAIESLVGPVDGVFAGHCGLAFQRRVCGIDWINAGVVGMPPHDGRPETRFALLDTDGTRFFRLSYDHSAARAAMEAAALQQGYHTTLETGIWPSEDVLPPALRRA